MGASTTSSCKSTIAYKTTTASTLATANISTPLTTPNMSKPTFAATAVDAQRYVTGHDAAGQSIFQHEGKMAFQGVPGHEHTKFYVSPSPSIPQTAFSSVAQADSRSHGTRPRSPRTTRAAPTPAACRSRRSTTRVTSHRSTRITAMDRGVWSCTWRRTRVRRCTGRCRRIMVSPRSSRV